MGRRPGEAFLPLGDAAVRVLFEDPALRRDALRRLVFRARRPGPVAGEIEYRRDRSLEGPSPVEVPWNAISIRGPKDPRVAGPVLFHFFGEFRVAIERPGPGGGRVVVRYPRRAPVGFLLDDVLQAAIQPAVDALGGFLLHGSCVAAGDGAVALLGGSGSGKSTTAFNLGRFGFRGVTDDAVVVTPEGRGFRAWPLTREVSLRTTSFRWLRSQGADPGGFRRDGRKFLFRRKPHPRGVRLRHLCFLRATGEAATEIRRLTVDEAAAEFRRDPRHFPLLPRDRIGGVADLLAGGEVAVHLVRLGIDLDGQGEAFRALLEGRRAAAGKATGAPGRAEKQARIRDAFARPGEEDLAALVPLLADFDIAVVATALTFFQNHPPSRLRPLGPPRPPTAASLRTADRLVPWARAGAFAAGVRGLRRRAAKEYVAQHAASWFRAAPILRAFLGVRAEASRGAVHWLGKREPAKGPVTVAFQGLDPAPAVALVRRLVDRGVDARLAARLPLCRLDPADALDLLGRGLFPGADPGPKGLVRSPLPECRRCALRPLALCGGAYLA